MLCFMKPAVRSLFLFAILILNFEKWNELKAQAVRQQVVVEIFEGLPSKWNEATPQRAADDSWKTSVLGFAKIPAKYNSRGAAIDRVAPFLMLSKFERSYPEGDYNLILRSRMKSILRIDGKIITSTNSITNNAAGHEEIPPLVVPADRR